MKQPPTHAPLPRRRCQQKQQQLDDYGGEWMLQRADAIAGFLSRARSKGRRTQACAAWSASWSVLAAEGEAARQGLESALGSSTDTAEPEAASLAALHQQLAADADEERLQLLAQVQELAQLLRRAACMEGTEALPSLRQELAWLQADIRQHTCDLAAAAGSIIQSLPALAASCSPTGALTRSGSSSTRGATTGEQELPGEEDHEEPQPEALEAGSLQQQQLQDLLDGHPLAPDSVKQQLAEQHADLQARHSSTMLRRQAQHQQQLSSRPPGLTDDESLLAGWLRRQLLTEAAAAPAVAGTLSTSRGCTQSALLDKIALRMPRPTRQQLAAHNAWHAGCCQLQRRLDAAAEDCRRERAEFFTAAAQSLTAATEATAAEAQAAAARLSTAVGRQLLHDQRAGLALLRQGREQQRAVQVAADQALEAARAAADAAARRQRTAAQHAQVQDYKQQLAAQQAASEQLAKHQQAAAAVAAEAAAAAARPVVARRQADAVARLEAAHTLQTARREAAAARQRRLAAIAALLGPQNISRDPQRVCQPTASSAAAPAPSGSAFEPVHGFTTPQVLADPRFRLLEALRCAGGLAGGAASARQGAYVRAAMAQLQAGPAGNS